MIVVDTSALVAILLDEPEANSFAFLLSAASRRVISAVTRVELSLVIEGRKGDAGRAIVARLIGEGGFEIAAVTAAHADAAIEAFRRFGKGRHPAGLNIGDCFSYALAKTLDAPLLFKGDDFARTDLRRAAPAL